MEILKRLRRVLREKKKSPWRLDIDPEKLSEKALHAWNALSEEERLAISKSNPFRKERNRAICNLYEQGLPSMVFYELTGMSKATIDNLIAKHNRKKQVETNNDEDKPSRA